MRFAASTRLSDSKDIKPTTKRHKTPLHKTPTAKSFKEEQAAGVIVISPLVYFFLPLFHVFVYSHPHHGRRFPSFHMDCAALKLNRAEESPRGLVNKATNPPPPA